jgi:hypothetical protein
VEEAHHPRHHPRRRRVLRLGSAKVATRRSSARLIVYGTGLGDIVCHRAQCPDVPPHLFARHDLKSVEAHYVSDRVVKSKPDDLHTAETRTRDGHY